MGQQNGKQQKPNEQNAKGSNSVVKKKFAFFNVRQKKASHRRRLPLEMECEIFKFLTLEIQTKFIWGIGRGIYGMFRVQLLTKSKRLRNPKRNGWNGKKTKVKLSRHGLKAIDKNDDDWPLYAKKGFKMSAGAAWKKDKDYPGTILYYFEVTRTRSSKFTFWIGLSDGKIPDARSSPDEIPNFYAFANDHVSYFPTATDIFLLSGTRHQIHAIRPKWNYFGRGDVLGCGLLLNSNDELSIFFTANGTLLGKQVPINPTVDCLYPTVCYYEIHGVEVNFGDNPQAKPFSYEIEQCPGLLFE